MLQRLQKFHTLLSDIFFRIRMTEKYKASSRTKLCSRQFDQLFVHNCLVKIAFVCSLLLALHSPTRSNLDAIGRIANNCIQKGSTRHHRIQNVLKKYLWEVQTPVFFEVCKHVELTWSFSAAFLRVRDNFIVDILIVVLTPHSLTCKDSHINVAAKGYTLKVSSWD